LTRQYSFKVSQFFSQFIVVFFADFISHHHRAAIYRHASNEERILVRGEFWRHITPEAPGATGRVLLLHSIPLYAIEPRHDNNYASHNDCNGQRPHPRTLILACGYGTEPNRAR